MTIGNVIPTFKCNLDLRNNRWSKTKQISAGACSPLPTTV